MKQKKEYAFISYSHKDAVFANRLSESLKNHGIPHWLDTNELLPGDSLIKRLELAIQKADFFVIILSSKSIESKWVENELQAAIHLQIEQDRRFIIPIIIDNCDIPLFIRRYLYVDFMKEELYETSIMELIKGIYPQEENESERENTITLFDELVNNIDDNWSENFRNLPLNNLWTSAIEFNSYEGTFREEFLCGLTMMLNSNVQAANGLISFFAFLKEIETNNILNERLLSLLVEIAEEESIEANTRKLIIPYLYKRFHKLNSRAKKQLLLPKIFNKAKTNNLANTLIINEFNQSDTSLTTLWEMGSVFYREDILDYITAQFVIDQIPESQKENFALLNDFKNVMTKLHNGNIEVANRSINKSQLVWPHNYDSFVVDVYVQMFEVASSFADIEYVTAMVDLVSNDLQKAMKKFGYSKVFNFFTEIIRSPNVDVVVSTYALYAFWDVYKKEGFLYITKLPRFLLAQRSVGLFKEKSILRLIIEAIAVGDKTSPIILIKLIDLYRYSAFKYSVLWEIKNYEESNKTLVAITKFIEGKITQKTLLKTITSSMQD